MISLGSPVTRLASFVNGYPFKPEQFGDEGLPVIRIRQMLDEQAEVDLAIPPARAVTIDNGDIVFSWSATLAVDQWSRGRALLNQHLFRVDPRPGIDPTWLQYVLAVGIERLKPLMHGSAMTHITIDMLRMVTVRVPELEAQRRIAEFLDAETARIDALVRAERRRIDCAAARQMAEVEAMVLGEERRAPVVNRPEGPLSPAPSTWDLRRNKTFLKEITDLSVTGEEDLLSVSHITGVTLRSEKDVTMFLAENNEGHKRVQAGDLVVNTMWAWMGALGVARTAGIVSPAYGVYRFTDSRVDGRYFDALFRSSAYMAEMTRHSKGVWTSRLRLYPDSFLALKTPYPPLAEQRRIADRVDAVMSETRRAIRLLDRSIGLLRERREALITAAVTGELEIPGVAA